MVDCFWNVMTHAQKPDFVFRRNGRAHLNRHGLQFSRLLAAEVCASAVVMLDTPCSEVVKGTGYPLHSLVSPSLPLPLSPCAVTFQLDSTCRKGAQQWGTTSFCTWRHDVARLYTVISPPSLGCSLCISNLSHLTVSPLPPCSLAFPVVRQWWRNDPKFPSFSERDDKVCIFTKIRLLQ